MLDIETEAEPAEGLRAPFPWFGGKSRVAPLVWERFGDVASYNEPFAGSLAVLLGRPTAPRVETVNDLDCFLANFWRAVAVDPDAVAYWADWPVNEADLHARHRWLVTKGRRRVLRCRQDPHYFDAKIAGWWVWGQCLWIGSGWCSDARTETMRKIRHQAGGRGVTALRFVDEKRPKLRERGDDGIPTRRWQGGGAGGGSGVHAPSLHRVREQMPALAGDAGRADKGLQREVFRGSSSSSGLYAYMQALATRLRRVRVCCGDWRRVLTPSVTTYIGTTGVFLDPPYRHDLRERCYAEDHDISADVRRWALEHGDDPHMRIALCGYEGEHDMPETWACVAWKAHGGYSRTERGKGNRERERIWFSPHCLDPKARLF